MGESRRETKKAASSKAGKAIGGRILVAEDNKALYLAFSG